MLGEPMLDGPAGWYRDPAPRNPAAPDTWRYWDGRCWTARTRTGSKRQRESWRDEVAAARIAHLQELLDRAEAGDTEAQFQLAAAVSHGARAAARGPRPAGWWARLAATLVDGLLVTAVGSLLAWPFLREVSAAYSRFIGDTVRAVDTGGAMPDPAVFLDSVAAPVLATSVILLVLSFASEVGFLKGCRATPGKLLLGLQVQPRDETGALTWRAVLLRWTGKSGIGLLRVVPFGVIPYSLYALADGLWPLGDRNRQALHDKLAGTYVVRRA